MIDYENRTDIEIDESLFEPILTHLTPLEVELIIVSDDEMQTINHQTRGIDKSTDVLSFPLEKQPGLSLLGTIIISVDKAQTFSKTLGHSLEAELSLLFIHGLLHLLGFDHEIDQGEMRDKEHAVIEHFNLPTSLIVRTEQS